MGLRKGQTNNKAGRPPGVPNRTTEQLRALVQSFIEANINDIQYQYDQLEAKDKLLFLEKMIKICLPPPIISLEQLTESQLDELLKRLTNENEKNSHGNIEPAA